MALNQTDSHSYPVFTLTSTLRGPKAIDITHLFTYTPPPFTQDLPKTSPMIPVFNHDLRHFTPAFILPSDENYYNFNEEFQKHKFIEKRRKLVGQLSNSNIEVVSPNQHYCQICKQSYNLYSTHILATAHRNKLKLSKAHAYIQDLCSLFSDYHQPQKNNKKRDHQAAQQIFKSSRVRKKPTDTHQLKTSLRTRYQTRRKGIDQGQPHNILQQ